METEITTLIGWLSTALTVVFVIAPTVYGYLIYAKLNNRGNPKIKMLEEADQSIVEGTNEALDIILNRLDVLEESLEEIANERKEVKGFRSTK
jgi:hypothetical protein